MKKRLLIDLLQRINIRYESTDKEGNELISITERGGDEKSIKNPVAWQNKEHKDRKLPFKK